MFRGMRRTKQQLSREDCEAILAQEKRGVLSLAGDGGYPYGVPLNFVYLDGKLYFHSAVEGHKLDAIASCDKACFTVWNQGYQNEGEWWYHVSSVICFGRARLVEDAALKRESLMALAGKYFPPGHSDVPAEIERDWKRVAVIELEIEHMTGKLVKEE